MGKGGTEINYPAQQGYGESMKESLQAQIDLAKPLFEAEASQQYGRPAYAQLETDILRDTLLGRERFVPAEGQAGAGVGQAGAGMVAGGAQAAPETRKATKEEMLGDLFGDTPPPEGWEWAGGSLKASGGTLQRVGGSQMAPGGVVAGTAEGATYTAPRPETAFDVGTETERWEAYVNLNPDLKNAFAGDKTGRSISQFGKEHYDASGKEEATRPGSKRFIPEIGKTYDTATGQEYVPSVTEGAMGRGGGLLDILGGTATGRFGTGEVGQEFVTRPATEADVTSGAAKYVGQEISEGRIRDGQMIGETRDVIGTEQRRAGFDPQGEFMGLAAYGSDIAEQAARRTRAADIGDVSRFAGVTREAMEAADPLSAGLLGADEWGLGAQAQEGLEAGRGLSPRQRREAEQAARAGWEARGLIRDPEAVVSEVESVMEAGGLEEAKRRAFAQNVMGVSQAMTADPFMAILGRPSGASQQIA